MSNTAPSSTGKESSAASEVVSSSSVQSLSQQSSDSTSQVLNSQGNAPPGSAESVASSVPLTVSQADPKPMSADASAVPQVPVKDSNTQATGSEASTAKAVPDKAASNSESNTSVPTLPFIPQTNPVDKAPAPAANGFHYSPGFLATSNLSQLAELAANKSAMNQVPSNTTQLPTQQLPPQVLGNQTRFVLPSQGMPPPMFGPYPSPGPMVHMQGQYQGFPPAPAQVPPPFIKGSIIQLATGDLKRVEDLTTEDFIHSTRLCADLKLETSTVVKIDDGSDSGSTHITFMINSSKVQVILNCPVEHPFFVYGQGWTSCKPDQSTSKYNLNCQHLKVGDVCIFLSPSNPIIPAGVALPSGPTTQVSGGNSTPTQSIPGVLSTAAKSPALSSGASQTVTSVAMSYAQTLAGMANLPGNIPGVVVTSSMPPGIPAVYPGTFPPAQSVSQGKATGQSVTVSSTQPVQGAGQASDGKPSDTTQSTAGAAPGGLPLPGTSYYQPLTGTFMTAMPPGQTFVQGTVMPPGSVGNGLLVAAVGFVPGRPPAPFVQPGMLYGTSPMEVMPKGAEGKPEEYAQKGRNDTQAELSQPEAKRAKGETAEVK